ncbi:penicillin-binding transpeptidase domain-containing protein [Nocardioides dongxiaopingii]|uniref:penicillin-binding transpeptidase domain-containing protein n=1 Tax=Nocardioides sp. S-1144 TaxID=2582905 RepID=UPI0021CB090E|nr:penicillin-binding transpeptidase domain-containing protein [Nocardioides sp. S-1144]
MRSRLLAVPTAAVLVLGLVACSGDDPDPGDAGDSADGTAAALAAALGSGDVSDVPFDGVAAGEVGDDLAAVVEAMGDITPEVTLGDVEEDGDEATATLAWSWPLTDDDTWTYESTAPLSRVDDEWVVGWGHEVVEPSLNASSVLELTAVAAERADILGAGGVPLVTERPVLRVGIDRTEVPAAQAGRSAQRLARLVDVDVAPYVAQVEAAGDKAFVEAIVYRADQAPSAVERGYRAIAGAVMFGAQVPLAPTREFAAPILGSVGPVTAEMIEEEPGVYEVGDVAGTSGLQARYDDQLRGTGGVVVNAVGTDGNVREIFRAGAKQGSDLALTLDEQLQTRAEAALADVGPASALVAVQPSTGAILAAANGPGNGGQNLATYGQYAPGSTFKSVSSLALLRRGVRPDTRVPCTTTVGVDGREFENYDDYPAGVTGDIPFRTAVANSCNTAFIAERGRLEDGDLAGAAASLGMGIDHDLGFPAYFGQVPAPESETGAAADMIGQGTVLASPLVMATVAASIQQGSLVVPRLLQGLEVSPPDGVEPVAAAEAAQLRELLRGVVTSGSGGFLADVPGPEVIAKTGTAEFEDGGRVKTHAWMIAAQGDLAVAVFVAEGSSGSGTAGPILEEFLRAAR